MDRQLAGREIGYYALILSIINECTPEEAFEIIAPDPDSITRIRQEQDEDMYLLRRDGIPLKEVAEIFCTTQMTVAKRVERYKRCLG